MTETYHIPAMLKETIEGLAIKPNGVYVDVTFGGGGHSRAILEKMQTPPQPSQPHPNPPHKGEGEQPHRFVLRPSTGRSIGQSPSPHEGEGSRIISGTIDEKKKEEQPLPNPPHEGEGKQTRGQNEGHLYSFDQDIEAYENAKNPTPALPSREGEMPHKSLSNDERWTFVHSNFRYLKNWMDYYGVTEIDGLLADLGVSFHHFDCPERGFSFRYSAPLDMRMNQTAKRTAADIVNGYSEEELAKIFWLYGELKNGRGIARNICKARLQKPILRTEELIEAAMGIKAQPHRFVLRPSTGRSIGQSPSPHEGEGSRIISGTTDEAMNSGKNAAEEDNGGGAGQKTRETDEGKNPPSLADSRELEIPAQYKKDLARLFQALRIEVNDELGALREMLVAARDLLKPGGRIAILTYHSLEDRLVKNFLRSGNLEGTIEKDFYGNNLSPFEVIEKGRVASDEEIERNPRSRSAKLRVAERKAKP